jgi:hypothetical protein
MESIERKQLVAPCGLDCGICEVYISKDNPQLFDNLIKVGIPKEKLPCPGCRKVQGNCPVIRGTCATYSCSLEKRLEFCYECKEFPCSMLQPASDKANVLPHNMKVFNLCIIKNKGIDHFINTYNEIKKKYYQGKMEIGKGPKL